MKTKWKLKPNEISKILSLFYDEGWCKNDIAKKFHVDHSTIHYHIKKSESENGFISNVRVKRPRQYSTLPDDNIDFDGEVINRGMNYADYLEKERMKQIEKQFHCQHISYLCTYKCTGCGKMHTEEILKK